MDNKYSDDWCAALLPLGATIQKAIQCLEASRKQIVLVVSEDNKLVGTITDGDVRRAFLNGFKLQSKIDNIINRKPLAVPPEISSGQVLQLMQINKVHQLPVVDQTGVVVGLHIWDSVITPNKIDNLMCIMAGGRGVRLRPYTDRCPKPMLEVRGKPILQHIIERAMDNGFNNFIISLQYLGQMIVDYFGDGSKFGVSIEYIRENNPLGTAGCLSLISHKLELPIIVTNGDVLADINYKELLEYHVQHKAVATMAVHQHEIQNQFGVVHLNGIEIEGFEEKPIYLSHVNAGIYVLNPGANKHLEYNKYCDMPALFEKIQKNSEKVIVYPMHEPWLDLGRHEDLAIARKTYVSNLHN